MAGVAVTKTGLFPKKACADRIEACNENGNGNIGYGNWNDGNDNWNNGNGTLYQQQWK